jgi:mannitol-1-phosphate/altronate dehydrogenase
LISAIIQYKLNLKLSDKLKLNLKGEDGMKLTKSGIKKSELWEKAGIKLPAYDVEQACQKAKENPVWVHFGIGNIFRIFIGGIADGLLEEGGLDRGITCVETFDYDVVDKIYEPFDNLGLSVLLHGDGTREYKVLGSLAEAVKVLWSSIFVTLVAKKYHESVTLPSGLRMVYDNH